MLRLQWGCTIARHDGKNLITAWQQLHIHIKGTIAVVGMTLPQTRRYLQQIASSLPLNEPGCMHGYDGLDESIFVFAPSFRLETTPYESLVGLLSVQPLQ